MLDTNYKLQMSSCRNWGSRWGRRSKRKT